MSDIFRISKKYLLDEIAVHSKRLAHHIELQEHLNVRKKKYDALYERVKGQVYIKYREKLIDENPKLMSEKYLDAKVNNHNKVKEARANLIEAERKYEEMKGVVKALHAKTEMLKEYGYNSRKEMEQGILRNTRRGIKKGR